MVKEKTALRCATCTPNRRAVRCVGLAGFAGGEEPAQVVVDVLLCRFARLLVAADVHTRRQVWPVGHAHIGAHPNLAARHIEAMVRAGIVKVRHRQAARLVKVDQLTAGLGGRPIVIGANEDAERDRWLQPRFVRLCTTGAKRRVPHGS